MYGPRFWYEITPFLFILTARGISLSFTRFPKITITLYLLLFVVSLGRLFSFLPAKNPNFFSPVTLSALKGFNYTDSRIVTDISKKQIHHAIIFVEECSGNWWCYGSVFAENSPLLNTDIIYAKDLGTEKNEKLINNFPGRSYYRISYQTLKLEQITQK